MIYSIQFNGFLCCQFLNEVSTSSKHLRLASQSLNIDHVLRHFYDFNIFPLIEILDICGHTLNRSIWVEGKFVCDI